MRSVVFFGTYNVGTTPRVQVLIDGLRSHDRRVTECNVPLPVDTAGRVAVLRQPWRLPLFGLQILWCWLRLSIRAKRMPRADAVIVGYMGQFDINLARLLFRRTPIYLDYMISGSDTARDRRLHGGFKDRLLIWLDHRSLRLADAVIVDTEEHRLALPRAYRHKGIVVHVGADNRWFKAAEEVAQSAKKPKNQPMSVMFFGWHTPLQGTPTIGAALALLEQPMHVTMVGAGQDLPEARRLASQAAPQVKVTWKSSLPPNDLPHELARHDVCLGVFGTGPKTNRVVPNKVYQGAAAGCAIVTADTPPQRRVFGENAVLIPAGDAQALAQALDELATDPAKRNRLRKAAADLARKQFSPAKIVLPLLEGEPASLAPRVKA